MVVIVSWYADGSGQPEVRFVNPLLLAMPTPQGALGNFIEYMREAKHKECKVYHVTDTDFEPVYDSTAPEKERKQ
jgi:hypothetical protein